MEVLYPRCAGLDVHKDVVVASARTVSGGKVHHEVESFGTTTTELLKLADWLSARECTHVAMEATGIYWKPVWHILEGQYELVLANAGHIKNVPGRKSDVNDATWIADLLAHGLIRGSFVPPREVQQTRDLMRTRTQLVRTCGQHAQRIQKVLEDANLKIASFITDILGKSGRAVLDALIAGETDAEKLVLLMQRNIRAPREQLIEALRGRVLEHHRFLLKLHLEQIDSLTAAVRGLEARLGDALSPFREKLELLNEVPGLRGIPAQTLLAEIGSDLTRFQSAAHLVSWAGLCPRMDESAGKRRSTRIRKGAPWLKTMLIQAAWSASRTKKSYFRAQYLRLKARRGAKKAIVAVAASMLKVVYFLLRDHVPYKDLGADYFDRRDQSKVLHRLVKRIETMGLHVQLSPAA